VNLKIGYIGYKQYFLDNLDPNLSKSDSGSPMESTQEELQESISVPVQVTSPAEVHESPTTNIQDLLTEVIYCKNAHC